MTLKELAEKQKSSSPQFSSPNEQINTTNPNIKLKNFNNKYYHIKTFLLRDI